MATPSPRTLLNEHNSRCIACNADKGKEPHGNLICKKHLWLLWATGDVRPSKAHEIFRTIWPDRKTEAGDTKGKLRTEMNRLQTIGAVKRLNKVGFRLTSKGKALYAANVAEGRGLPPIRVKYKSKIIDKGRRVTFNVDNEPYCLVMPREIRSGLVPLFAFRDKDTGDLLLVTIGAMRDTDCLGDNEKHRHVDVELL